ncbi:MAG: hypothetical protein KOO60_14575 [Gemmatimonadales bacterium]|nr:hypothetical protein [Gemmatimonadales bacterium]
MASTGKKWAIGCGIGCGFFLLIIGAVGTCGYFSVRQIVDKADGIEESFNELDAQLGHAKDFVPDPEGRIPADRMEIFLAVRQELAPSRDESSLLMARLEDKSMPRGPARAFDKIKAGIGFIPAMMAFIEERNHVLLARGMGLGEYQYIYSLAFFGVLEKDPSDGPDFQVTGPEDEDEQSGPIRWGVHRQEDDSEGVRDLRAKETRRYLNKALGLIVRNQLEELDRRLDGVDDPDLMQWRVDLAAEVEAMETEPRRILWEEGLPPQLLDSIEPYRDRLEDSYEEMMNVVEMGLVNHS